MDSFEKIVAQIAAEKPWRGVLYWIFFLVWRWSLTIFTVLVCLASRQNALVTILLTLISIFLDYRYVPRAPAFRLSDTEFVRKTCRGEHILGDNPELIRYWFVRLAILAFLVWVAIYMALYGLENFESSRFIFYMLKTFFVFISFFYIFVAGASLIAFCSYAYPPWRHPPYDMKMPNSPVVKELNSLDYAKRSYLGLPDVYIIDIVVLTMSFLFMVPLSVAGVVASYSIEYSLAERFWLFSLSLFMLTACVANCPMAVMTLKSRSVARRFIQLMEQRSGQQ